LIREAARRTADQAAEVLATLRPAVATLAGMQFSSGAAVVVMDVDLQDPPELITPMVRQVARRLDRRYAQRRNRRRRNLLNALSRGSATPDQSDADVEIRDTGDSRLMSRRVVDEILRLKDVTASCVGWLPSSVSTRRRSSRRPPRYSGWPLQPLSRLAAHRPQRRVLFLDLHAHAQLEDRFLHRRPVVLDGLATSPEARRLPFPMGNPHHCILILF